MQDAPIILFRLLYRYLKYVAAAALRGPSSSFALGVIFPDGRKDSNTLIEKLHALDSRPEIVFIQVGSNDGISGDPLHENICNSKKWRGVLVEPVPYLYEKLQNTYVNQSGLIFENAAVSSRNGESTLYHLPADIRDRFPELPEWSEQLGSFSKKHIERQLGLELTPYIQTTAVSSTTLSDLAAKHDLARIDLIHTDTEGHDFQALSTLSKLPALPEMILFEHKHLRYPTYTRLLLKLRKHYEVIYDESDALAIRIPAEDEIPLSH